MMGITPYKFSICPFILRMCEMPGVGHVIRSEIGLSRQLLLTVPGCWLSLLLRLMTARCKIKEQKQKDFYLILCPWSDTESEASRGTLSPMWTKRIINHDWRLEPGLGVTPGEYYQTCHKRKCGADCIWISEFMSYHVISFPIPWPPIYKIKGIHNKTFPKNTVAIAPYYINTI